MVSLLRTTVVVPLRAASAVAGPSSRAAGFATSVGRWMVDDKNGGSSAREHRPRSAVGPGAVGQMSSALHSKEENLGVNDASTGGAQGKTQRDAIDSAMGVLDTLARDVAASGPAASNTAATFSFDADATISTPSSPSLSPVWDASSGPIYTPSTLPPRSDPTLEFLTNLLMKDGKKAQAQRFTTRTLSILATITNSNPLPLIHDAISRTAPLVKMQTKKQGGKSLHVPVALTRRQSERKALTWIIEASKKRPDRELEKRLAAEFLAVVEGTSNAIGKKEEQHRIAMVNRANAAVRI